MSNYHTGNLVPSTDPRDLDDNATVFDLLLSSVATSVSDRTGKARKTWHQMELDAEALISPNVAALAGLTGAADKGFSFTGVGAMSTYTLAAYGKNFLATADQGAARSYLGLGSAAIVDLGAADGAALLTSGSKLLTSQYQTPLSALSALTPAADRLPYFNGTSTAALAIMTTYGRAFLAAADSPTALTYLGAAALASPAFTGVPTAPTPAIGTNTTQLATAAMVFAEIANKRTWNSYTPTITAESGTYTSASATGSYMIAFGVCHFKVGITITTKGSGVKPTFTLPATALAGASGVVNPALETSGGKRTGSAQLISTTQAVIRNYDGGDIVPGDGTTLIVYGSYPVA